MSFQNRKVSDAVIKRLPRYFRYLADLKENNVLRISSKNLSEKMGLTASQIRQDFSCFGGFGLQGYGYNVELLYNKIKTILGIDEGYNTIIIGAGNIGRAIARYPRFGERGFHLKGIFDIDKDTIGQKLSGVEVQNISKLEKFVKETEVDIAILAVPRTDTATMAQKVVDFGIKGIWNFSAVDLDMLDDDVVVENVHLSDSIMILGYKIKK